MHLLELGLCNGTADSVDGKIVVTLKLFHGRLECRWIGLLECSRKVSQIIQPGNLPRGLNDRIQISNLEGNLSVFERCLRVLDDQDTVVVIGLNIHLDFSAAVCCNHVGLGTQDQIAGGIGYRLFIRIAKRQP